MNWEIIGVVAELLAAAGVIASLIYLSNEVRHNSRQSRATARYSFVEAYGQINLAVAQDKSVAAVLRKGLESSAELDADEKMQFFLIIGQYLNTWSVMVEIYEDGLLPETQWYTVRKDIVSVFKTPGGRSFWESNGRLSMGPAFASKIDKILEADDDTLDFVNF